MDDKKYFITLTGAKKNIGDFLITDRCKRLLRKTHPSYELVQLPHWQSLDDKLKLINNSKGIIIFGGPGYQPNMYPGVYKLTSNLDDIKVPIIPLGLGWKGFPGDFQTLQEYRFNSSSIRLLEKMAESNGSISCRDYYTAQILRNNGIKSVVMTGCPTWYNLEYLTVPMDLPSIIEKVVYTPAQRKQLSAQSIEVMHVLKNIFPNAEIYSSFHRGIGTKDEFTDQWDVENTRFLAEQSEAIGLIPVDTAFDLSKSSFYSECDIHVGYRVHAHINFLSMRKPSLLIHEDGRGRGVSDAMNVNGVDGFKRKRKHIFLDKIPKVNFVAKKLFPIIEVNHNCSREVEFQLQSDVRNSFVRYAGVGEIIDTNFKIMNDYLKSI